MKAAAASAAAAAATTGVMRRKQPGAMPWHAQEAAEDAAATAAGNGRGGDRSRDDGAHIDGTVKSVGMERGGTIVVSSVDADDADTLIRPG